MARKTIDVNSVRNMVNKALAVNSESMIVVPTEQTRREGLCSLLESILQDTGNYHGFGYQKEQWIGESCFRELAPDYDDTRRIYY